MEKLRGRMKGLIDGILLALSQHHCLNFLQGHGFAGGGWLGSGQLRILFGGDSPEVSIRFELGYIFVAGPLGLGNTVRLRDSRGGMLSSPAHTFFFESLGDISGLS